MREDSTSQAVLQSAGHGGASERRSYVLTTASDTINEVTQETGNRWTF